MYSSVLTQVLWWPMTETSQTRLGKSRIDQQTWALKSWAARKPGWGLSRKWTTWQWDHRDTSKAVPFSVSLSLSLSVSSDFYNKKNIDWMSHPMGIYFLTVFEARSSSSECQNDWVLVRALFLACRWPWPRSHCVCSHGLSSVYVCGKKDHSLLIFLLIRTLIP